MNYLVVVAHPDDEVLGAGATIHKLIREGNRVALAILSGQAAARANISATLSEDQEESMKILGIDKVFQTDFPNIRMNTVAHLDIVRYIENCIMEWQAEAIITHHPSDVNIDHQEVSKAVNAASRLFQRTDGVPKLRRLMYMEVPSSTEWSLNASQNPFVPNLFVEIGKEGLEKKLEALSAYVGVMRPYPHPRSTEALTGLAACRGAQAGVDYAEAFQSVFCTE